MPDGLGFVSAVESGVGFGRAPAPGVGDGTCGGGGAADGSGSGTCTGSAAGVGVHGSTFGIDAGASGRCAGLGVLFEVVILFLHGLWCEAQALGSDCLGGLNQHQMGAPLVGLKPAALGRAQTLLGELKLGEVLQHLAGPGEPGLKARGKRAHG